MTETFTYQEDLRSSSQPSAAKPILLDLRHRRLRVLYFDHTSSLGGGELALLNLLSAIDRSRVFPIVVLGADGPLAQKLRGICDVHILPLARAVKETSKDTLGVNTLFRFREVLHCVAYICKLARLIRTQQVDLVHTNSLKADLLGGIAGRMVGRKVLWHVRDRIEEDYLPRRVVQVFRLLCRIIPHYIIANSAATLATLHLKAHDPATSIPSGIPLKSAVSVVYDGLEVNAVSGKSTPNEAPMIGLVGRIAQWKGQHVFLDAAAVVHERFPSARFKIIGAALFGEHDYEVSIREQCVRLSLQDCTDFTGFCTDISSIFSNLTIAVHASISGEPFGQVLIEAMAAGKPVVATNGGGVPEIVVDRETGLLVPMQDSAAMANAICELLSKPKEAKRMGQNGLNRVKEHFTIQHVARRVVEAYDLLCVQKANTLRDKRGTVASSRMRA